MKHIYLAIIAGLFFAGCATPPTPPVRTTAPFVEDEFTPFVGSGDSTITGSAFLKTIGGEVKVGAGNQVELIPATSYTSERFQLAARLPTNTRWEPRDPRLAKYIRTTTADAQGNFEFRNIPPGAYILACVISWQYADRYGLSTTGGQAFGFVSVSSGETKRVVVTR